jgi:Protein of unknown function (DUF2637)
MWSRLPTNLRTILGCALVLGIGVTAAAFTLSFFALRAVAENPQLEFGKGHAWLFPIALDMALIFAEVLLLGASMVKDYNRAIPILLVLAFGIGTLYFNVTRVPDEVRVITAVPPLASIFMTIGLAYLMKMLTAISGSVQQYHLGDPVYGQLGAPPTTTVVRLPDGSYGVPGSLFSGYGAGTFPLQGAFGQMPSSEGVRNPQIGHAEIDDATKRRAVEMYLSHLTADQLGVATASSIVVALAEQGMPIGESYAGRILSDYKAAQKSRNGARTTVRRKK